MIDAPQAISADTATAIRDWCDWIHNHAELAQRAMPMRTPEGQSATWLDHCSVRERDVIEGAMRDGIWRLA